MRNLIDIVETNLEEYEKTDFASITTVQMVIKDKFPLTIKGTFAVNNEIYTFGESTKKKYFYVIEKLLSTEMTKNIDPNNIIGYVYLQPIEQKIWQVTQVKKFQSAPGVIINAYAAICYNLGVKLINGEQLTNDGVALWGKIGKFHTVKLYYKPTKEIFDQAQIGEKTSDNLQTVAKPSDGDPDFYWLLEANKQLSEASVKFISYAYDFETAEEVDMTHDYWPIYEFIKPDYK